MISVSTLLLAVNSASNFVIYMLRGDKFRRVFSRKIMQICCRRRGANGSAHFDSPRYVIQDERENGRKEGRK